MKTKIIHACAAAALVFSSLSGAVVPVPPPDDNGDVSFVRQVVPKLLGRKPKGTREVNLLADIAGLHGREALVRMLMEQPEFASTWIAKLADQLELQRERSRSQSAACYDAPTPSIGGPGTELGAAADPAGLAAFVRDNDIQASYASEFNMYDLMESAIALDNLFPIYRAYLYSLGSRSPGGDLTEAERQQRVGVAFDSVFLHRKMECMSCHRGTYSTTGVGVRTHPLYETLELAMYDHIGSGEVGVIENDDYVQQCQSCHGTNAQGGVGPGILGWSADALRGVLQNPPAGMAGDFASLYGDDARMQALAESLNGPFGQAEIESTAALHYAVFRTDLFENEDGEQSSGWGPWGIDTECASIHGVPHLGAIPTFFAGVADDYASIVEVDQDLVSGYENLPASLPAMQAWDESESLPGDVGFAYMVAAKITDNVWEALMGERLTIVNQFARNNLQRDLHKHLTEDVFIAGDWSLKELIVAILETRFFNRRAPAASMQASPYLLQPIFDPFVPADQVCASGGRGDGGRIAAFDTLVSAEPERDVTRIDVFTSGEDCAYNGQGELVHRYSPDVLLRSVGVALGWPAPRIFATNDYPSMALAKSIGQYASDGDEGTKDVTFLGLLSWDGQYGMCDYQSNPAGTDWIERLVGAVDTFNAAHPQAPLTLGEVVLTMKDWLLQEPVFGGYQRPADPVEPVPPVLQTPTGGEPGPAFAAVPPSEPPTFGPPLFEAAIPPEPTEADRVADLFAMPLDTEVDGTSFGDGSTLRALCGAYLKSPQFMLAGVVRDERFEAPRLRVCNGEPCDAQSMCEAYADDLGALGYPTVCSFGSAGKPLPLVFGFRGGDDEPDDIGAFAVIERARPTVTTKGLSLKR